VKVRSALHANPRRNPHSRTPITGASRCLMLSRHNDRQSIVPRVSITTNARNRPRRDRIVAGLAASRRNFLEPVSPLSASRSQSSLPGTRCCPWLAPPQSAFEPGREPSLRSPFAFKGRDSEALIKPPPEWVEIRLQGGLDPGRCTMDRLSGKTSWLRGSDSDRSARVSGLSSS